MSRHRTPSGCCRCTRSDRRRRGVVWVGSLCLLLGSCPVPGADACAGETESLSPSSVDQQERDPGRAGRTPPPRGGAPPGRGGSARTVRWSESLTQEYDDNVDNDSPREQKGDFITLQ